MEHFSAKALPVVGEGDAFLLHELVAADIETQGYSVQPHALPPALLAALQGHVDSMTENRFKGAGIGRADDHAMNAKIRSDQICWITGDSPAGAQWLHWADNLRTHLNRRLFMGLFSFESHFAHYAPGAFYRKHVDAFRGQANRVLTLVVYLNEGWHPGDGGELLLYDPQEKDRILARVSPTGGTVVAFLSEEFPHEVLPAREDRYSIAGWFRVNNFSALQAC